MHRKLGTPPYPWAKSPTAPRKARRHEEFEVTHPFHPLLGQTFEVLRRRKAWGDERVMYLDDAGATKQIPLAWTNLAPVDAFVQIAAGRCALRTSDLLALVALVRDLGEARR